jgi:hypothetical protein
MNSIQNCLKQGEYFTPPVIVFGTFRTLCTACKFATSVRQPVRMTQLKNHRI